MAINKRLLVKPPSTGITPSEHFGVVLYEGDGSSSHSINGGKFGAAAYFGGSGNITPSGLTSDQLGPNGEMSISWWMNTPINDTTVAFICEGDTDSEYMVHLGGSNTRGMRIAFAAATTNVLDVNNAFTANTWQHFVAIMTPTGNKLYRDGSLVGSNTFSETRTNFSTFYIGSRRNSSLRFEGKLDQLRIFAKELSSSEVSTLYAETASTVESLDPLSEDTTDTLQVLGDSSCLATYRFENNEDDLSGNYDGTGTQIQYAAGRYGQAASYDGSNSKVSISALGFLTGDVDFSVSMWVKFENVSGDKCLFSQGANAGTYQASGYIVRGNNQVYHNNYGSADFFSGSFTFSADVWTHIAFSYNSTSNVHTMYINGSSAGTVTKEIALQSNNTGGCIGADQLGGSKFKGEIDQVRVFNKTISASEVTTLYNENSLVASYRFEGNANDDTRNYDASASNVTYEYGLNFTPDLVWIKDRGTAEQHILNDSTRGATKDLSTNTTAAEATRTTGFLSFDTGGFTLGSDGGGVVNDPTRGPYVAWCWKANGGTTSSNTDGDITSIVQANQQAGFSIVQYTGSGVAGDTIGHGLSAAPELIIVKNRSINRDWSVVGSAIVSGNSGNDGTRRLVLNDTVVAYNDGFGLQSATDTTFAFEHNNSIANNTDNFIAYAFHSVENFSKFGSYTGNGSATGPIVETGFEPAFVMIKGSSLVSQWNIVDNRRDTTNPATHRLFANLSNAEATGINALNFLSNGFEIVNNDAGYNSSGQTYIYMAFAADPDTEAPAVAKSFSTVTYTGDGTTGRQISTGFQPSLVWTKGRNNSSWAHFLQDSVRGAENFIKSNTTDAEATTLPNIVSSFNDDGFVIENNGNSNANGDTYVAWAWKADDNEPTISGGSALAVYKFEDNANDVRGNYNGTATNITYTTGKFNKAAVFVESNSSEINFNNSLHGSTFSMSFWLKATDMGAGTSATAYSLYSAWIDVNNYFRPVLYGDGSLLLLTKYAGTFKSNLTSTGLITENTWHHIVFNFTPTDTKAYVDGVNVGTFPTYDSISFTSKALGTDRGTPDFTGQIDQLRFYDAALIQENVTALYNETAADNDDLTLGAPGETIISANANAGFSIVKYTGDGVAGKQVPHGLSATPEMIILKNTTDVVNWFVWHKDLGGGDKLLELNTTSATKTTTTPWNSTVPSSTVFTVGTNNGSNGSGDNIIAYCFHSVSGYSKIGSYSGTSSSGNSVNVGFAPDWVLIKGVTAGSAWILHDTVRSNGTAHLRPNTSGAEDTGANEQINFTSTGFSIRNSGATQINTSGHTYIYMAFKIN